MQILTTSSFTKTPWKNGKGFTAELYRFPENSSLADFDLRISIADVNEDGNFSFFHGYKRFISVLEGNYFLLSHNGNPFVKVNQFEIHSFSGSDPTFCKVDGQILKDFNVIVSEKLSEKVEVYFNPEIKLINLNSDCIIYVVKGSVETENQEMIQHGNLIMLSGLELRRLNLTNANLFLVEIT